MRHPHRFALTLAVTLLGVLAVAGCSRRLLTAPAAETSSAPAAESTSAPTSRTVTAQAPPDGRLAGPSILALGVEVPPIYPLLQTAWRVVTSTLVRAGEITTVKGERYELHFARGSLAKDALITIQDYDHDVLDVELGPHGIQFGEPVLLSIDISGTAADPGSVWYDHREPVVYWLNEEADRWEVVPSRTDWSRKRVEVRLEHFSRYVVGGKAGWKGQPNREQE